MLSYFQTLDVAGPILTTILSPLPPPSLRPTSHPPPHVSPLMKWSLCCPCGMKRSAIACITSPSTTRSTQRSKPFRDQDQAAAPEPCCCCCSPSVASPSPAAGAAAATSCNYSNNSVQPCLLGCDYIHAYIHIIHGQELWFSEGSCQAGAEPRSAALLLFSIWCDQKPKKILELTRKPSLLAPLFTRTAICP